MKFIPIDYPLIADRSREDVDYIILRNRRVALGLTQQQVADMAKINLRQYQRVESGERHITGASAKMMLAICAALKINPYDLFPDFLGENE